MKKKTGSRTAENSYLMLEGSILHGDLIEVKTGFKYRNETMDLIRKNMTCSSGNPMIPFQENELLDMAIVVHVNSQRFKTQDLDNVAKVVLDAIKFKDGKELYFIGDDNQIVRLLLIKERKNDLPDSETSQLSISIRKHDPTKEMKLISAGPFTKEEYNDLEEEAKGEIRLKGK